MDLQSQVEG